VGILSWIILGTIAGILARLILSRFISDPVFSPRGLAGAIPLGIAGAFLGGVVSSLFGVGAMTGFSIGSILVATMGSIVVLTIYLLVKVLIERARRAEAGADRPSNREGIVTNAQTDRDPENLRAEEPLPTPENRRHTLQSKEPRRREETKGIFISYRRDESAGYAGRIADSFQDHFGEDKIFRDIDSIEPGLDFAEAIERAVGSSEVVIAVIGKNWLTATDAAGHKRLEDTNDYVRMEIAAALQRNIRVVPLLVQGASMPSANELPDDLAPLARRNAFELHDTSWRDDVRRLTSVLERVIER
jgi:uncharacterized membrane protein YeaQ/YmgE (transglycosylase-associated protein family)